MKPLTFLSIREQSFWQVLEVHEIERRSHNMSDSKNSRWLWLKLIIRIILVIVEIIEKTQLVP
jgi:hypothetical protein